ncbi:hypothetical protein KKG24_02430 [Patescibacteria group bacterium]|nr:hypothetical protein [Patescibacteria group bacterium]
MLFFQNVLPTVLAVVLMGAFFGFVYLKIILVPRRKKREADQLARLEVLNALSAEEDRVRALPKLNTRWLMRVPPSAMINGSPRSFGTRYNRIRIFDEYGLDWVGLITPEILEGLIAGEYIWSDYFIPFRGAGEAYAGNAVNVDGLKIDIFPRWMTEGINLSDWVLWARIEKNFLDHSREYNYQSGLAKLNERQKEFREKRTEFKKLANLALAKMDLR